MDLYAFSAENRARCEAPNGFNHPLGGWTLSDWMVAITGELGEAANVLKKLNRVRDGIPGNTVDADTLKARLASELADTFIYLDLFAQAADIDLPAAVRRTFDAKSAEIGYRPDPAVVRPGIAPERISGISLAAATELVALFGGAEADMTIARLPAGPSGPGFYGWCTEYPEEGADYLGPLPT